MSSVLVTGAAGGIGQAVVGALAAAGWTVVGADRVPFADKRLELALVGDLRDPAFVASCLAGSYDAVVHLAAIPAPGIVSEAETYAQNTQSAYELLDAAGRTGVPKIVAASSFAAVGIAWADRDQSPLYVPIDEKHPTLVIDSYGLSKVATEQVAAFVSRRWGVSTACLRFPFVGTGKRLADRVEQVRRDVAGNRRELWAWIDTRDAARAVLAVLDADLTGSHVFNFAAPDSITDERTDALLREHHPTAEVRGSLSGHASLVDTTKSRELLGFRTLYGWRDSA
jgi:nucleoside-diphosphate-sugar epimerase